MAQSKIVILEADQQRREYIRSIVSDRDYIPYIFEKETICLDNLQPLDPDLVISGINGGPNLGDDWFGSGTIGAARTAAYIGIPSVARLSEVEIREDSRPHDPTLERRATKDSPGSV